jgi:hypothetical protein
MWSVHLAIRDRGARDLQSWFGSSFESISGVGYAFLLLPPLFLENYRILIHATYAWHLEWWRLKISRNLLSSSLEAYL